MLNHYNALSGFVRAPREGALYVEMNSNGGRPDVMVCQRGEDGFVTAKLTVPSRGRSLPEIYAALRYLGFDKEQIRCAENVRKSGELKHANHVGTSSLRPEN